MNIFRALFGGRKNQAEDNEKEDKSFDVLKADGEHAFKTQQFNHAAICLTQALGLNPGDWECRDILSQVYVAMGDMPHAYEQLQKMVEANPKNVDIMLRLADVAGIMDNYTAMADACEKALLIDDGNVQTYTLYAKACRGLGDDTNADAMLTKASLLKGENPYI